MFTVISFTTFPVYFFSIDPNRVCESYRKEKLKALEIFHQWLEGQEITDIRKAGKKEAVKYYQYLCEMKSKRDGGELKRQTVNDRFYVVKLLYSLLYRNGVIDENPIHELHIEMNSPSGYKRRPFSQEEMSEILERLDIRTVTGLRDRTLFELIYSSGLRVCEAAGLKVKDIDFERREIIVKGKFGKERMVPVSKVAKEFLELYLEGRIDKGEEAVFPGSRGSRRGEAIRPGGISERFRNLLHRFKMDRPELSTWTVVNRVDRKSGLRGIKSGLFLIRRKIPISRMRPGTIVKPIDIFE